VSSFLPTTNASAASGSTASSTASSDTDSPYLSDAEFTDNSLPLNHTASFYTNHPILPSIPTFPARSNINARAHVDCADYFAAVARAIDGAKREVFITGWFLTPELCLLRNPLPDMNYRLDRLLFKKAREGVRIYIILWDETKIAVFKGSRRAKEMLEGLHSNVKVLRHPPFTPIYWSHHQKLVVVDQDLAFVGGVDLCFGRYDTAQHKLVDLNGNIWPGKDYYNPTVMPMGDITRPFEDGLDRVRVPRMPWHDVMISVDGDAARDVAMNFILRWNHHRLGDWDEETYPILSLLGNLPNAPIPPPVANKENCTTTCQVLRSISEWSGSSVVESTINVAYLEAIEDSEHYIYIENQNFVSSTAGIRSDSGVGVKNLVAVELLRRIKRAIRKKETFRVYIMLPIQPDGVFEEEASVRGLMHWQYLTISRGGMSIVEQLRRDHPDIDPFEYISFYSLRTHDKLDQGVSVTEQVYVHSKMMIVDDRVVIIGSNNMNDRSLLGDRDSELAIIVRDDSNKVNSKMNGVEFVANKFAHTLRVQLFKEYLGILNHNEVDHQQHKRIIDVDVTDPTSSSFYHDTWMAIAQANTKIYEHVFNDLPRDSIETLADYVARYPSTPVDDNLLEAVQGYLVLHPLDFLSKENLSPSFFEAAVLRDELFQ
jgi:phospholipase D1/2